MEQLRLKIENLLCSLGFELWDMTAGSGTLNIYADKTGGSITVDECAIISERASFMLKNESLLYSGIHITVSSPGINRKLKTKKHFEKSLGKRIKLVTNTKFENQNFFIAVIKGVTESGIEIELTEGRKSIFNVPFSAMKEACIYEL